VAATICFRYNQNDFEVASSVLKCCQVPSIVCKWQALGGLGACSGSVWSMLGVGGIIFIKFYQFGLGLGSISGSICDRFAMGLRLVWDGFGVDVGPVVSMPSLHLDNTQLFMRLAPLGPARMGFRTGSKLRGVGGWGDNEKALSMKQSHPS